MNDNELGIRLKGLKMTKKELADSLGMAPESIYRWGIIPDYAVAYIELLEDKQIAMKKVSDFLEEMWR